MKKGNTVIVIEHNLDVVKVADHVVDLGPDGGDAGGQIIFTGTPEALANSDTHTGHHLREELERFLDDDTDEEEEDVDLDELASDADYEEDEEEEEMEEEVES